MNKNKADIIKAGAIILKDSKVLISQAKKHIDKDLWTFVGGKPEGNESMEDALEREVLEELGTEIKTKNLYAKSPIESAAGKPDLTIQITMFVVELDGEPSPSSEIHALHWLSRKEYESGKYNLGSVLQEIALPKLIEEGLVY